MVVHGAEGFERFKNAVVGVGEVEFVFAVIVEKKVVGRREAFFIDLGAVAGGERAAHEHRRAVADKACDGCVGQRPQENTVECRVDTVAKILRRVDQRAVEIEDEQLEAFDGEGAENLDHDSSVKGPVRDRVADPGQDSAAGLVVCLRDREKGDAGWA